MIALNDAGKDNSCSLGEDKVTRMVIEDRNITEALNDFLDRLDSAQSDNWGDEIELIYTQNVAAYKKMTQQATTPGSVVLVVANSTMLANLVKVNLIRDLAIDSRCPSMYVSDENETEMEFVGALISSISECDLSSLMSGQLNDTEWESLSFGLGKSHEAPLTLSFNASSTLTERVEGWSKSNSPDTANKVLVVSGAAARHGHSTTPTTDSEVRQILDRLREELSVMFELSVRSDLTSFIVVGDPFLYSYIKKTIARGELYPADIYLAQLTSDNSLRLIFYDKRELNATDYPLKLSCVRVEWADCE